MHYGFVLQLRDYVRIELKTAIDYAIVDYVDFVLYIS